MDYDWPGNVRELENTIKRMLVLCSDKIVSADAIIESAPGLIENRAGDNDFDSVIANQVSELV
nr:sigma-54-dependent Fis family transcriptional regulator [Candidatus Dadabacteria bacterium]